MDIRWLTAFVDMPADRFEAGAQFWLEVTDSKLSARRGDHAEFATVIPPTGDPYLRIQRIGGDHSRIHLDLHVDSISDATNRTIELGASLSADLGHSVMASPAGLPFCLVSHEGEATRTAPNPELPHLLDQVSIDIPGALFESECRFWSDLTGWELRRSALPEFASLVRPDPIPYRVLLQRLGNDDPDTKARAHLDIACGDRIDDVALRHEELGAINLGRRGYWVTMRDPAGLPYCLTPRDPATGQVPA